MRRPATWTLRIAAWFLVFIGVLFAQDRRTSPAGPRSVVDTETSLYEKVLGLIFPESIPDDRGNTFVLSILLRKSNEPESRIVVRQGRGPTASVEYSIADSSIDHILNRSQGEQSPQGLANKIHVDRRAFQVPSERAFAWQGSLLGALAGASQDSLDRSRAFYRSGSVAITLDGDAYDIVYKQGVITLTLNFSDPNAKSVKDSITNITNDVESLVRKR